MWSFVSRWALVPVESVAIPETGFLVIAIQTVVIWFAHAFLTVLQSCSHVCPVLYLSVQLQPKLFRSQLPNWWSLGWSLEETG